MSTPTATAVGHFVWHDHVSQDRDAAKDFYSALLGWEIETWKPGEMDYPMIKAGERHQGRFVTPENKQAPSHWAGYVQVDDADETVARAEKAGATIYVPPTDIPDVGRFAAMGDPQGAILAIIAPQGDGPGKREMPSPHGGFCWDELMTTDLEAAGKFYADVFGWELAPIEGSEMGIQLLQGWRRGCCRRHDAARWSRGAADVAQLHLRRRRRCGGRQGEGARRPSSTWAPMDIPAGYGRFAMLADPAGAPFGLFTRSES